MNGTNPTPAPVVIPNDPGVKPGVKTTEFWFTVFTNIIGAVVAIATLLGKNIDKNSLLALVPVASLLVAGLVTAYYNHSRGQVKQAATYASAQVRAVSVDATSRETVQHLINSMHPEMLKKAK